MEIPTDEEVKDIKDGLKPPISPEIEDHFDLPQPEYEEDK